jgi:hypothetical protein
MGLVPQSGCRLESDRANWKAAPIRQTATAVFCLSHYSSSPHSGIRTMLECQLERQRPWVCGTSQLILN